MADAAAPSLASLRVNRRLAFVRWVRKTHGWFGLWGALLGLMMGTSGVWLNHRATLKLELPAQTTMNAQLALPDPRAGELGRDGDVAAGGAEDGSPGQQRERRARASGAMDGEGRRAQDL